MKTYFKIILLGIIVGISFSSCEDDVLDPDGGDERDKFVGTWHCAETSETGTQISYTVNIGKMQNSVELWIEGYAAIGFGDTVTGIIAGGDINIYSQVPCPGCTVEGEITYEDTDLLNGDHDVIAGGDKIHYTAVYSK